MSFIKGHLLVLVDIEILFLVEPLLVQIPHMLGHAMCIGQELHTIVSLFLKPRDIFNQDPRHHGHNSQSM